MELLAEMFAAGERFFQSHPAVSDAVNRAWLARRADADQQDLADTARAAALHVGRCVRELEPEELVRLESWRDDVGMDLVKLAGFARNASRAGFAAARDEITMACDARAIERSSAAAGLAFVAALGAGFRWFYEPDEVEAMTRPWREATGRPAQPPSHTRR